MLWQAWKLTHWDRQTTYGSSWSVVSGSCSMWSMLGRRSLVWDTCLHASTQCHACQACWFTNEKISAAGEFLSACHLCSYTSYRYIFANIYLTVKLLSWQCNYVIYWQAKQLSWTRKVATNSCSVGSDVRGVENAKLTRLWPSFSPTPVHPEDSGSRNANTGNTCTAKHIIAAWALFSRAGHDWGYERWENDVNGSLKLSCRNVLIIFPLEVTFQSVFPSERQ